LCGLMQARFSCEMKNNFTGISAVASLNLYTFLSLVSNLAF